jgi:hypothetical protein
MAPQHGIINTFTGYGIRIVEPIPNTVTPFVSFVTKYRMCQGFALSRSAAAPMMAHSFSP